MTWSRRPAPGNWSTLKASVMVAHAGICHVCRHGGSDQIDHKLNVARGGSHRSDNLAPIHQRPCTTCGKRCHVIKTAQESLAGRAHTRRARPTEPHPGDVPEDQTRSLRV